MSLRAPSSLVRTASTAAFACWSPSRMPWMRVGIASSFRSSPVTRLSRTWSSWRRWRFGSIIWWAHPDSNQDQAGYEPAALPVELWARTGGMLADFGRGHKPRRGDGTARSPGVPGQPTASARGSRLEEAPELLRARGVAELPERLGLDLPDALARHGEVLADLLQGVLAAVGQAEAEAEHLLLARGEGGQHLVRLLAERQPDDRLDRR